MKRQTIANKKWQSKNPEKARYLRKRSIARTFIQKYGTEEDLLMLRDEMDKREQLNAK
ncbi:MULTISPECIES: hypothetical protein [unclassified Enterococcus]|uniref:hypothetical protein n=1 Tax=unclassified Enterococcus TaxID=2608891 RepID=UPI00155792A2|nr:MULTISPECIES: hypothetical protein [unclassified Enterococcus]MBS7578465.1 hypothetical protein [Enterococcus sp. MMGLQ5-2]MBS7585507.1 hypothetical protein [Enterococcus sp. MMGLQ5-1]NPD13364.1 hypothetical protein [Enterococcus sp. MMGLQ5-1]NPD38299.1 hypothetical protein [Enterococcus sp. MMGLQ5-2]